MRLALALLLVGLATCASAQTAVVSLAPVAEQAWQGEALTMAVELRARGTFSGAPVFDLPEVPGVLIVRIGNPVVSSLESGGQTWFVQRHEFAVIAQRSGELQVPGFSVRFAAREGFTGEATARALRVPAWHTHIRPPPGTTPERPFVTSTGFTVDESWDGLTGRVQVGDVLVRHVHQRAEGTSGMVLLPVADSVPGGVRVYRGRADVSDRSERGLFRGERSETLSYLPEAAGAFTLPALEFLWWNPATEELQTAVLPAVNVEVQPAGEASGVRRVAWPRLSAWVSAAVAVLVLLFGARRLREPPALARARFASSALLALLRACRRDAAADAHAAWWRWQAAGCWPGRHCPRLHEAVAGLQRSLYAGDATQHWSGRPLARAAIAACAVRRARPARPNDRDLPPLNPPGDTYAGAAVACDAQPRQRY